MINEQTHHFHRNTVFEDMEHQDYWQEECLKIGMTSNDQVKNDSPKSLQIEIFVKSEPTTFCPTDWKCLNERSLKGQ